MMTGKDRTMSKTTEEIPPKKAKRDFCSYVYTRGLVLKAEVEATAAMAATAALQRVEDTPGV